VQDETDYFYQTASGSRLLKQNKLEIWGRAQRKATRGYASMPWSISSAFKNLRGKQPLQAEIKSVKKCNLGGSTCAPITFLFVDQSSPSFFGQRGRGCSFVVDQLLFRFSICGSVPEIFAIEVDSCLKSRQILDVFCPPKF